MVSHLLLRNKKTVNDTNKEKDSTLQLKNVRNSKLSAICRYCKLTSDVTDQNLKTMQQKITCSSIAQSVI